MSVDIRHWPIYEKFFRRISDSPKSILVCGHQDVLDSAKGVFPYSTVDEGMRAAGHKAVTLDWQDARAHIRHNLNIRIDVMFEEEFDVVFDIGTIEHVANSMVAFENYFSVLKVGGVLFLITPVKGYFNHGLHTFSPEFVEKIFSLNGFVIREESFVSSCGKWMDIVPDMPDVDIVIVAEKVMETPVGGLIAPQQGRW